MHDVLCVGCSLLIRVCVCVWMGAGSCSTTALVRLISGRAWVPSLKSGSPLFSKARMLSWHDSPKAFE